MKIYCRQGTKARSYFWFGQPLFSSGIECLSSIFFAFISLFLFFSEPYILLGALASSWRKVLVSLRQKLFHISPNRAPTSR